MARFRRGTTFLGRYVLLGPIGHGGVSVVYEALDTFHDRHVAIKMLDPTLASDTRAQERIRREAIITDRMRHPSVPRVYEYGDAQLGYGTSVAYVVMELLVGTVLADYLDDGPLPWLDAVQVAATVSDVLAVAHKRGVVHRDLTPANIMITENGARIIDFGVAVTVRTPNLGPFILPPNPLSNDFAGPGEPADDVYALGVLLYRMVTGRPPSANHPPPTATAAMGLVAPAPVLAVPGVPRELAEICRRCMVKRPADRPDAATAALDLWALIVPQYEMAQYETTPYERAQHERAQYERAQYDGAEHDPGPADRGPREWPAHERPAHERRWPDTTVDVPAEPEADPAPNRTAGPRPGVTGEARPRRTRPSWTGRSTGHRTVDRARRPTR